jgi:hypothetical protein
MINVWGKLEEVDVAYSKASVNTRPPGVRPADGTALCH